MAVMFDGAGFQAEKLAAQQFKGILTNKKEDQYKDIDLFVQGKDKEWRSVSVKDQLWSSGKYNSIQIELSLTNTRTNQSIQGCFYTNQADYYFWRVSVDGVDSWLVVSCFAMKQYVKENIESLKTWNTTAKTEEKNRTYNRTYDRASGVVIPLSVLLPLGSVIEVKGV